MKHSLHGNEIDSLYNRQFHRQTVIQTDLKCHNKKKQVLTLERKSLFTI